MQVVRANGLRFSYIEEGRGPLVLLLHGFPDTPQTWDKTRPALAEAGFRAVSPFMRGYAPTEVPKEPEYDADTLGRDVLGLIEALGEERAFVVGHDWGAVAAYSAAGLQPTSLRMLITVAVPHPASFVLTPQILWGFRHILRLRRQGICEKLRAEDLRYVDELVRRWSPDWNIPPAETDAAKRSLREPGSLEAATGYYRALSLRLSRGQRARVRVPAVAFAGRSDVVPPSAFERARRRYLAHYEIILMPGGHFMHRESPEHFSRELVRVLNADRTERGLSANALGTACDSSLQTGVPARG
jgi:pimeloyl-ACP methyl ester carboxylesterase